MNKAAQAYFKTNVNTTDQGRLLLMLYDGALNFLQQARDKMLAKDYAAKGMLISKVIDIVNELSASLNLEKGGSLAENLNNLYFLCTARLLQANLKMNVEQLDSVGAILSGLRSAYAQILQTPEAQAAGREIASRLRTDASVVQRAPVPLSQPLNTMPLNIGQMQARAAYGRQAVPAAPAPDPAPAASGAHARVTHMPRPAPAEPAPASPASTPAAPAAPAAPAPAAPAPAAPRPVAPVAAAVPKVAPAAAAAPRVATPPSAVSGLAASARMYQKMAAAKKD